MQPRKVLAIFETPTVFILESSTPEVLSALGINPELDLTILLRKDGVIYSDKGKKVKAGNGAISAGKAWESIASFFKGKIFAVKEDIEERGISKSKVVSQIKPISKSKVTDLINRSDTIMIY
ncbi:MAG: hypothetical protein HYU02_03530 [Thaumarchaeota archaeon]|nr:hypothetical protein [Nitrososphaerota archaeon]